MASSLLRKESTTIDAIRVSVQAYDESHILSKRPWMLYDVEEDLVKDMTDFMPEWYDYLKKSGSEFSPFPPFWIVSHVWGTAVSLGLPEHEETTIQIPGAEWGVPMWPVSKWDSILGFCREKHVRWLWMDALCVDQRTDDDDPEVRKNAAISKAREMQNMGEYYRIAEGCLVLPQGGDGFSTNYRALLKIYQDTIIPRVPIHKPARALWKGAEHLAVLAGDDYFHRMWTFQELLLSTRRYLLDKTVLNLSLLQDMTRWYIRFFEAGACELPSGSQEIDTEKLIKTLKELDGQWSLRDELRANGYINALKLLAHTAGKGYMYRVDRLFALYGLLRDDDKIPIEVDMILAPRKGPIEDQKFLLDVCCKMMGKAFVRGDFSPLLNDFEHPRGALVGRSWIPSPLASKDDIISGLHAEVFSQPHRNTRSISVSSEGLYLDVRLVGLVLRGCKDFDDRGNALGDAIFAIWDLGRRGFDRRPAEHQLVLAAMDGLKWSNRALSFRECDETVKRALNLPSIDACVEAFKDSGLSELVRAGGSLPGGIMSGNHRAIIVNASTNDNPKARPLIVIAWLDRRLSLPARCVVLDVTSGALQEAKRWMIAEYYEDRPRVYKKVGSVAASAVEWMRAKELRFRALLT
ncbi:hypothetical protein CONPUDRAFT_156300 [Coniophora puteana RWD-64-598 SS2]|uniref:Heterokaryon incompatibility domain-containing protein n=1 Tax=Coniophora puteana (strain RWD-64-598) TaxID=741705 RepID=A0A5M3MHP2_CONPW|nr:uncharacterized protein CONPUDRAFT_156300 [Coniophora puteana RWD-64-598 SS2]EIW78304.1 hypothetical protein CONPUDRAFT_156300 [Coniophora puteana RWD-64-598 SS2]